MGTLAVNDSISTGKFDKSSFSDLHVCRTKRCAKAYLKNTFINTQNGVSQNGLSWDGTFVCSCYSSCFHITAAGVYKNQLQAWPVLAFSSSPGHKGTNACLYNDLYAFNLKADLMAL